MKEETMTKLNNFFKPGAIAIIGASDHEDKVGGILLKKAIKSSARIIPVNPGHKNLRGLECFERISDYKGFIDLAVIAIPSKFVIKALKECGKKGIKNVVIISAGFSEIGDSRKEKKLKKVAKKYGIRFLGPNCFGIFNSKINLDLTFSSNTPAKGNIAFVSQSGALWSYLSDLGMGFSFFASLGNMGDLEFSEIVEYLRKDKETKSIVFYIEKLKLGRAFMTAAKKAIASGKKLYAIKAGSSKEGSKAALSHTASLATDYNVYKGAFKQINLELCETLEEAIEKASGKKFNQEKIEEIKIGKNLFIITNAGGAGVLVSDYLSNKGFHIVNSGNLSNPFDILGTAYAKDYQEALEKSRNINADTIIVILTSQSMSEIDKTARIICNFKETSGKDIIAIFLGKESFENANSLFEKNNINYFNNLRDVKNSLVFS